MGTNANEMETGIVQGSIASIVAANYGYHSRDPHTKDLGFRV